MFSARAISSMIVPFVIPYFISRVGIRTTTLTFATCCTVGQYVFILGLQRKSYRECLISRIIFGVSDSMTIVQQTIMCLWFTPS